ncbi:MAG: hypothetical protein H6733_18030 [Alphaproteobacteria bacterium]|nr:hypothetical protein [Alphaproteobacteria bacterium]
MRLPPFVVTACVVACHAPVQRPHVDPCVLMRADTTGPMADRIAAASDPVEVARLRREEARQTADPGFDLLADHALACAAQDGPLPLDARRMAVRLDLAAHRFTDALDKATTLVDETDAWTDHLAVADARLELGDLDAAAAALDAADARRPSALTADRAAALAWRRGDLHGAMAHYEHAARLASAADPTVLTWELAQLGWLQALDGGPVPALDAALRLSPGDRGAHYHRGLWRLSRGDVDGARADLRAAGPTIAATVALAEIDPTVDVRAVHRQDPRGWAIWLAPRDPQAALALLDAELGQRHDAITVMAHAWATHLAGGDGTGEARRALATGTLEPQVLWQGAQVLGDPALLARARTMPAGLLPSQRAEAIR